MSLIPPNIPTNYQDACEMIEELQKKNLMLQNEIRILSEERDDIHQLLTRWAKDNRKEYLVNNHRMPLLSTTIQTVLDASRRKTEEYYHNAVAFRDVCIIQLEALRINIHSVRNADTHREKDSRLRGLEEVINIGISNLRGATRQWQDGMYWGNGLLDADSSLPTLMRRKWELEQLVEKYHIQYGALKDDSEMVQSLDEDAF